MPLPAFSFTKLVVNDLDTAERFYCAVFHLRRLHRVTSDAHQYALDEVVLSHPDAPGGHALIITRYLQRPCPPPGAAWTGFVVPDIDATLSAVAAAGGKVEVPVHGNPEHDVRAAIAADPEGHLIEIIQMLPSA